MANISTLTVSLVAETAKFQNDLKRAKGAADKFGKSVRAAGRIASAALTATAIATGALVAQSRKMIDQQQKMADRLGLTQRALAGLTLAGEQTGTTQRNLQLALQRSTRRISEAAQGTGTAVKALQELGVEAKDLAKLSPDEAFIKLAGAFNNVTDQSDKVRLAFKLFDSEGVGLVNTLKLGEDGIRAYIDQVEKLGIALNRNQTKAIEDSNDATNILSKSIAGLGNQLAVVFAPAITRAAESLTAFVASVSTNVERIAINVRNILNLSSDLNTLSLKGLQQEYALAQEELTELQESLRSTQERLTSGNLRGRPRASLAKRFKEDTARAEELRKKLDEIIAKQKELANAAPATVVDPEAEGTARPTFGGETAFENVSRVGEEIERQRAQWEQWRADAVAAIEATLTPSERLQERMFQIRREFENNPFITEEVVSRQAQEAVDAYLAQMKRMRDGTQETVEEIEEFQRSAFQNMQTILADYLFDPFEDGLDGMLKSFVDMLRKMVAQLLAQKLLRSFFERFGLAIPGVATTTGNAIGIGRTDSRARLVGENGPELFQPGASGSIRPIGMLNFAPVTNINAGGDSLTISALLPILEDRDRAFKAQLLDEFDRGING